MPQCALQLDATLIPVKYKEKTTHRFVVLRSQEGQPLATGDLIQTFEGENVTSELGHGQRFRHVRQAESALIGMGQYPVI